MPVKFNTKSGVSPLVQLQESLREKLGLSPDVNIIVNMSNTMVRKDGVMLMLPIGAAQIKNGSELTKVLGTLATFLNAPTIPSASASPMPGAPVPDFDAMSDEQWAEAVADQVFTNIVPLCKAKSLHEPVQGTSGGSVYRTCFMGSNLLMAARLKQSGVSLRATTPNNECPSGEIRTILQRLGLSSEYADRMTGHAPMSGPYNESTAHEYRALFGAYYAALRPHIHTPFPSIKKLSEGVK